MTFAQPATAERSICARLGAGTDVFAALTPLLSHATARPRQAGTSFESQAQ